jgi:hypothetical protein
VSRSLLLVLVLEMELVLVLVLVLEYMLLLLLLLLLNWGALAFLFLISNSPCLSLRLPDFPEIKPDRPSSKRVGLRLPAILLVGCTESAY